MKFLIKRVSDAADLPLPRRMSGEAAGFDLYANVHGDTVIQSGERALIPSGVCVALPKGYEAQVRPRSGLALKHGVTMLNAPGTVDSDFRGQIHVLLINLGEREYIVRRGDRIAQLVVAKVETVEFTEADALPESERGCGGFGHTGE